MRDWNFESPPVIGSWLLGQWIAVEKSDALHDLAAACTNDSDPTGLWMYQIADESTNRLWLEAERRSMSI